MTQLDALEPMNVWDLVAFFGVIAFVAPLWVTLTLVAPVAMRLHWMHHRAAQSTHPAPGESPPPA